MQNNYLENRGNLNNYQNCSGTITGELGYDGPLYDGFLTSGILTHVLIYHSLRRNHLTSEIKVSKLSDQAVNGTNDRQNGSIAIVVSWNQADFMRQSIIATWLYIELTCQ